MSSRKRKTIIPEEGTTSDENLPVRDSAAPDDNDFVSRDNAAAGNNPAESDTTTTAREDTPVSRGTTTSRGTTAGSNLPKGSRPPPTNRPSTSALSVLFVMGLVVVGSFIATGSFVPINPNGPGGPPTLAPYYNPEDYPVQKIITPTGGFGNGKQNLQLETFQVDNCGNNMLMLFVIDVSGSMQFYGKIDNEKKALSYFTTKMGGLSAIGIDTFSVSANTEIPLSYYKDVKQQVASVVNGLTPNGYTSTRDAMELAYTQLQQSIADDDYPGYKYNVVLMTDGVPEIPPPRTCEATAYDPNIGGLRCFAKEQDPTVPPDISQEIRDLGADIYVINVYSPEYASDKALFPYLNALLEKISSQPLSTHYYISINGSTLPTVLQSINQNICENILNGS
jgi:von Willebrand factor type A domain